MTEFNNKRVVLRFRLEAGAIASLSLSGGCIMEMRKDGEHRAIYLPARSLLIMAGASRYEWLHYIPHRKSDVVQGAAIPRQRRVSFTFRKVTPLPSLDSDLSSRTAASCTSALA